MPPPELLEERGQCLDETMEPKTELDLSKSEKEERCSYVTAFFIRFVPLRELTTT